MLIQKKYKTYLLVNIQENGWSSRKMDGNYQSLTIICSPVWYQSLMRFSIKNTEKIYFLLIFFKSLSKLYNYFSLRLFYTENISYINDLSVNWIVCFFVFRLNCYFISYKMAPKQKTTYRKFQKNCYIKHWKQLKIKFLSDY